MICERIKELRISFGLTELQVSKLIYYNCYRYKKCEINDTFISVDMLVLLSVLYGCSLNYFFDNQQCALGEPSWIKGLNESKKIERLKENIYYFSPTKGKSYYKAIQSIVTSYHSMLSSMLKDIRCKKNIDINEMSNIIGIDSLDYLNIENGKIRLNMQQLKIIHGTFGVCLPELN